MKRFNWNFRSNAEEQGTSKLVQLLGASLTQFTGDNNVISSMQSFVEKEFEGAQAERIGESLQSICEQLKQDLYGSGFRVEAADGKLPDYNNEQLKAAALVTMGLTAPVNYSRMSLANLDAAGVSLQELDQPSTAAFDAFSINEVGDEKVSQQAFDEQSLRTMAPVTQLYNLRAPRQGSMEELFYPTLVVDPETPLIVFETRVPVIPTPLNYTLNGNPVTDKTVPLLKAVWNSDLLKNNVTKVVPYYVAATNADKFVLESEFAPVSYKVGDVSVPTLPLKFGVAGNLMAVSAHPDLMNNNSIDYTDQLDRRVKLDAVYLRTTYNDGTDHVEYVKLPTGYLVGSTFLPSRNGVNTDLELTFNTSSLSFGPLSRTIGGTVPGLVAAASLTYNIVLKISVYGTVNYDNGNYQLNAANLAVAYVTDDSGNIVDHEAAGAVKDAVDAAMAGITLDSFDIDAIRTNSNRRFDGLQIDTRQEAERIGLPIGSPFTAKLPIDPQKDVSVIASHLVTAATITTSHNAISSLMAYADQLDAYMAAKEKGIVAGIEGIGRYLMEPTYLVRNVDCLVELNSQRTFERSQDLHALLTDRIREVAYAMYDESHYQAALDYVTETPNTKPLLLIGTKGKIAEFLSIDGEPKILGAGMDYKIGITQDTRVDNTIWVTFGRPTPSLNDATAFGVHLWMPQLVSTVTRTTNGSTYQQAQVIPRSIHVHKAPVLGKLNLQNLEAALISRTTVTMVTP